MDKYANKLTKKGNPYHKALFDPVETIRLAELRALWTDDLKIFPDDGVAIWWEIWLRRDNGQELKRIREFALLMDIELGERSFSFTDRTIALVNATANQLSQTLVVMSDIAEVRLAKESAAIFLDMKYKEQFERVKDLVQRTIVASGDIPAVCNLDTGVTRGHPLLKNVIEPDDTFAVTDATGKCNAGENESLRKSKSIRRQLNPPRKAQDTAAADA